MAAMAAILEKLRHPFSIGFFSYMGPIHPVNFKLIDASVHLLFNGNQIQDGCHGGHIGKVATPILNWVLLLHGPSPPYEFQIDRCKRSPVISTETKFKMAAILEKLRHPLSIGIFCLIGPIYPVNLKSISASVLLLLSGNQIQDGCHGGHIGKVTTPIFIRVLLLDSPNPLYEFQIDRCKRSHVIERKPNSRWLLCRPYWKIYDTHLQ